MKELGHDVVLVRDRDPRMNDKQGGTKMLKVKKQYVVKDKNEKVAVQIDLQTFAKIER